MLLDFFFRTKKLFDRKKNSQKYVRSKLFRQFVFPPKICSVEKFAGRFIFYRKVFRPKNCSAEKNLADFFGGARKNLGRKKSRPKMFPAFRPKNCPAKNLFHRKNVSTEKFFGLKHFSAETFLAENFLFKQKFSAKKKFAVRIAEGRSNRGVPGGGGPPPVRP